MKRSTCSGLILAGGRSSRMGQTKALLPFKKQTFLGHLVSVFQAAGIDEIVAVGGADYEKIAQAVPEGCRLVRAEDWALGMRASLRAGLRALPLGPVLLTHVDRPSVSVKTIEKLLRCNELNDSSPRIPCFRGETGHPVYLPAALRSRLLEPDDRPLNQILEEYSPVMVEVEDADVLLNINTPEDWRALCEREGSAD